MYDIRKAHEHDIDSTPELSLAKKMAKEDYSCSSPPPTFCGYRHHKTIPSSLCTVTLPRLFPGVFVATNKHVFTLRLSDEVFDKIGILATDEHHSMTNYIEYVLIQHLEQMEKERGRIGTDQLK